MSDEVIKSEIFYQNHTDVITHKTSQPTEDLILDRNQRLRNEPEAFADRGFGRQIASIPFIMYEKALREGYQLNAPDNEIANKEMLRYLKSEEGKKCLVGRKI